MQYIEKLRNSGLRPTKQRLQICEVLFDTEKTFHFTINQLNQKIKKQQILDANNILLEENPDIVASVKKAHPNKKVIGFAAETENVLDNAKLKLSEKELDLIIANDVSNDDIGFDSDDNEVHLISEKNSRKINKSTKEKVSREIIKYISDNLT